jgi:general secretion pathway protein D
MPRWGWTSAPHVLAVVLAVALAACAPGGSLSGGSWFGRSSGVPAAARDLPDTPSRQAAREGIAALSSGDFRRASRDFNRALKFEPDNSHLHFLNALAYHQLYANGGHDRAEYAEAGYILALEFDRSNALAALQLGRLYMELRRYADAQRRLADAVRMEPEDAEAWNALAAASYYTRDVPIALHAIETARRLQPDDPAQFRTSAVIRAAVGQSDAARSDVRRYAAIANEGEAAQLTRRVQRWASLHDSRSRSEQLSQLEMLPTPPETPATPGTESAAPAVPASESAPLALNWSDCAQTVTPPSSNSYGSSNSSASSGGNNALADETVALPALPSPCTGRPAPRMAVFDVAIIRSDDTDTTSRGVNLLAGLQVLITGSRTRTSTTQTSGNTESTVTTGSIGLPVGGITYSLNIANATDNRNEVLARPSLTALDRQPSNFFSGSNISVALSGQYGGSLTDKPIGVSLSATPTFIDDETMLIAVRATRSFLETAASTTLQQSVQTSRNAISANVILKFDQTLILSGLREREITEGDSGVPILKDIPIIQNLFAINTSRDFTKDVLILLTPRRPAYFADLAGAQAGARRGPAAPRQRSESLEQLRGDADALVLIQPNLNAIVRSLNDNHFMHEFRTGDIVIEPWRRGVRYDRLLRDVLNLLYF